MTTWTGAGLCPAGLTPAGYGYLPIVETAKPQAFRMADGSTGEVAKIDAKTGDYVLDDKAQKLGMTAAQQQVLLALKTIEGSAYGDFGIERMPETINDRTRLEIRAKLTNALADLRARGIVELVRVDIQQPKDGALLIFVEWRDVSRGTVERTPL